MKQEINRFTAHTNCPPGEYLAIFTNSEEFKYPRGDREILSFLILKDEKTPLIDNKGKAYYSVIVCNKTKGVSTKSKISKIKLAMLNKDEYNPLDIHIGLPKIENFYDRKFKVLVTAKGEDYNFITHIQRPRDLEWEHIEMEYEGGFIKDPRKLYNQLRHQILAKKRKELDEAFEHLLKINDGILLDKDGNFINDIDYNSQNMFGPESYNSTTHKKILKFLETQDLSVLFSLK
tara:strand:+ start:630 stop:1328 length:699 start_codon:yes stop_codon:yes gene_type:complete